MANTSSTEKLWTEVGVIKHDVHRLKSDMTEIADGMKTLLQRDASRPEPVKLSHMASTVGAVLAVVVILTGFIQWQINAVAQVESTRGKLAMAELRLEIAKSENKRRIAWFRGSMDNHTKR